MGYQPCFAVSAVCGAQMVDRSSGVPTALLVQGLRSLLTEEDRLDLKMGAQRLAEPLRGSSRQGRDGPCSASCLECSMATSEERAGFYQASLGS